jgi:hypothetical protein
VSDRLFGLVSGALFVAAGLALYLRDGEMNGSVFAVGAVLAVFALLTPRVLAPLNRACLAVARRARASMSPAVVAIRYVATILPGALIMRLRRQDPLTRGLELQPPTYWLDRRATPSDPTRF